MEVVLLWLDDLDDAIFTLALAWEPMRQMCLQIGLMGALLLALAEFLAVAAPWSQIFSTVAAGSVIAWGLGVAARAYYDQSEEITTA